MCLPRIGEEEEAIEVGRTMGLWGSTFTCGPFPRKSRKVNSAGQNQKVVVVLVFHCENKYSAMRAPTVSVAHNHTLGREPSLAKLHLAVCLGGNP